MISNTRYLFRRACNARTSCSVNTNLAQPFISNETMLSRGMLTLVLSTGKNDLTLTATLEFVEVCIVSCNIPQARNLLNDAETLVHQMFKSSEEKLIVLPYLIAKIETLRAKCYIEAGLIIESERVLKNAISSLGYKFPKLNCVIDVKSMIHLKQAKLRLIVTRDWKIDAIEENGVDYAEQLADTLSLFHDMFKSMGMKRHARLAAIWSLNAALTSNKSFSALCKSFTIALTMAHTFPNKRIIPYLVKGGIGICNAKHSTLELQELRVIAELYASIFFARCINGEIIAAIRIGVTCDRLSRSIGSTFLKLNVLPRLIHLLMITCQHSKIVALLRELEFISENETEKSARTWYYALCIDIQLDTGLSVQSFRKCEQYYLREGRTIRSVRDQEAQKRYFTSMWLWCVRTGQWEATKFWNDSSLIGGINIDEHIVTAMITALKRLEGLLISYVHRVNCRNVNAVVTMTEIKAAFRDIRRIIPAVKIAIPRYALLKAYYNMIKSRRNKAVKFLRRAKRSALKTENRMIYVWAEHCQKAWSGTISSVQEDMWTEVCENKLPQEWDEVNVSQTRMMPFTFPLAKYIL